MLKIFKNIKLIIFLALFLSGCAINRPAHWFTAKDGYQWRAYESDCEYWYDPITQTEGLYSKDPRTGESYRFVYFRYWEMKD